MFKLSWRGRIVKRLVASAPEPGGAILERRRPLQPQLQFGMGSTSACQTTIVTGVNIVTVAYRSTTYYVLESRTGERLLIDCGWPGTFGALKHELERKDLAPNAIGHILVTHYHPDHAGLVEEMKALGAIVPTPGHSDDSVSLLLDDGAAFVGDLTPESQAAPDDAATRAIWRLLRQLGALRIYPAHGGMWQLQGSDV